MQTINKEISVFGGKKAIVSKTEFTKSKNLTNSVDPVFEEIDNDKNQYDVFKEFFINTNVEIKPNIYLDAYKNIIKYYFNSINDSIYLKTAQELGLSFSGAKLFQNTDFQNLIDIQKLKEEINKDINENPCIILDPELNEDNHPLKNKMIKESFMLLMQAHIIDIQLRNILLVSVFDSKSFYKNDSTFSDFCFETFFDRVTKYNDYYQSVSFFLYNEMRQQLENGNVFINPISNKEIEILNDENTESIFEDSKQYIKYLFSEQFIKVCDSFNNCFNRSINVSSSIKINLSNLITPEELFFNNVFQNLAIKFNNLEIFGYNISSIPNNTFFINLFANNNQTIINFSFKINNSTQVSLFSKTINIDNTLANILNSVQQTVEDFKNDLKNNEKLNILINYCFSLNKALNFASIGNVLMVSKTYPITNNVFEPCFTSSKTTHNSMVGDDEQVECEAVDASLSVGMNAEIAKLIAQTPLNIIKSLEETFDPNIAIANKLKKAAESVGSPDLSIIPYSAYLMVLPPFGPGIQVIPPLGYVYWGISAAETAYNISQNGFGGNSFGALGLDTSGSFDVKNPFKPKC